MAELFYQTVHHVNVRDYSKEQVDVVLSQKPTPVFFIQAFTSTFPA